MKLEAADTHVLRCGGFQIVLPTTTLVNYLSRFFRAVGYIGEFEIVDDHRAGKIVVEVR